MLEDFIRQNPGASLEDYNSRVGRYQESTLSTSAILALGEVGVRILSFMELVASGSTQQAAEMRYRLRALEAGTVRLDSLLTRGLLMSLPTMLSPVDGQPVATEEAVTELLSYSPDNGGATQEEWDAAVTKVTRQNDAAAWREQVRVWSNSAVDAYVQSGTPLPTLS
jgi:hypothetical protein